MNAATKNFLEDLFIEVYNNDFDMFDYLGSEKNILFLHKNIFGKMITIDEIEDCARIVGDDDDAWKLARSFVMASNRLEKMFNTVRCTSRQLRRGMGIDK